jgi:hypothetical protein
VCHLAERTHVADPRNLLRDQEQSSCRCRRVGADPSRIPDRRSVPSGTTGECHLAAPPQNASCAPGRRELRPRGLCAAVDVASTAPRRPLRGVRGGALLISQEIRRAGDVSAFAAASAPALPASAQDPIGDPKAARAL